MIFYDMGAQDTTATVVGYQIVKTKERGFAETHPQVGHFVFLSLARFMCECSVLPKLRFVV
jgi:hypothetical protein